MSVNHNPQTQLMAKHPQQAHSDVRLWQYSTFYPNPKTHHYTVSKWLLAFCAILPLQSQAFLSEERLITQVSRYFPTILMQRDQVNVAKADEYASRGIFDPQLGGNVQVSPQGNYEHRYVVTKLTLPVENSGLKWFGGYSLGRGDWPVYYQNYWTNRYGEPVAGFSLPLLRNNEIDVGRTKLAQTTIDVEVQKITLALIKNQVISQALDAYYDWIAASMQLVVYQDLLKNAIERQQALDKQISLGDAARLAKIENDRFIAQRRANLKLAKQHMEVTARNLSLYYRDNNGRPIIVNHTELPHLSDHLHHERVSTSGLHIIQRRQPELQLLDKELQKLQVQRRFLSNQRLPQLDAEAYVEKDPGPGANRKKTSYYLKLNYQIPIQQREVQGQLAAIAAKQTVLQRKTQFYQQQLTVQLTNFITQLNANIKLYQLSVRERELAKALAEAERKKFYMGDSNLFLINQREQSFNETELKAINSLIDYYHQRNQVRALCLYGNDCFTKFQG